MKNVIKSSITAVIIMVFTACGAGSSSGEAVDSTITGTFVESVAGLNYLCDSGSSGTTNSLGEYTCKAGEKVKFLVGSYEIGSAWAAEKISVYTLYPSDNVAAINVAQLLETIDADQNHSNGITIPDGFTSLDSVTVIPTEDDVFDVTIQAALAVSLIDGATAKEHLNEVLGIPYEGIGFTAAWLEGKTLYSTAKDTLDSNNDGATLDWILVATKYENGFRLLDLLGDGTFEETDAYAIDVNGVLEVDDGTTLVTREMIEVDAVRIKETMTVGSDPGETVYEFFNKSDAENYVLIKSYPCSCGYFTSAFLEGNTLYSVVLDSSDYDGDGNFTEQIMIASKYENGIRSLDYNANGVFDVTTDTFVIDIDGILEITSLNGDWIRQEILSASTTNFTVRISVSSGAPDENRIIFYNQADAQAYMNTLL